MRMSSFLMLLLIFIAASYSVQHGGIDLNWDETYKNTKIANKENDIIKGFLNRMVDLFGYTIFEGANIVGDNPDKSLKYAYFTVVLLFVGAFILPFIKWLTIIGIWINEYRLRRREK